MNKIILTQAERLMVAATLMGEARGEIYKGKVGVAWVIRNRMEKPSWWCIFSALDKRLTGLDPANGSAIAVCRKSYQFSCWNRNDPSYSVCQNFSDPERFQDNLLKPQFSDCLKAVDEVFSGVFADTTFGATHYLNPKVANPAWDDEATFTTTIGRHKFYKGVK